MKGSMADPGLWGSGPGATGGAPRNEQRKSHLNQLRNKTRGWPAVYHRDRERSSSWLLTSVPTPICLRKHFSCKACLGMIERRGDIFRTWRDVFFSDQSYPKPWHTTGGSGRAAHGGTDGRGAPGWVGRRRVCSRRTQPSLVPSRASKTTVLNISSEARKREIFIKTVGGTKPAVDNRLISGLSPGREALFVPGCWPMYRRLFVFVSPFYARHVREKEKIYSFFLFRRTIERWPYSAASLPTYIPFPSYIIRFGPT